MKLLNSRSSCRENIHNIKENQNINVIKNHQ